jgi:signal transduction histidine kinase
MSPSERRQFRDFIWRFRGWRGLACLAALLVFNVLLGLAVNAMWPRIGPYESILLINLIALTIVIGGTQAWFSAQRLLSVSPRKVILVVLLGVVGGLVGGTLAALGNGEPPLDMLARAGVRIMVAGSIATVTYLAAMGLIAGFRNRELKALNAKLVADADRERLNRELAVARLRLLQAQVEPHFLFNTLGAVQQLAERGAPEAAALTGHLIRFLRSSIGSFRPESTTLDRELQLVDSYLQIMQLRLGRRLAFTIDASADVRNQVIRPTLLITLVENAIKHGIEPHPPGGAIRIAARREEGALVIDVADTGAGMPDLPGSGHGLANVREQLRLAYGERAGLDLFDNTPQGVIARLHLPLE